MLMVPVLVYKLLEFSYLFVAAFVGDRENAKKLREPEEKIAENKEVSNR